MHQLKDVSNSTVQSLTDFLQNINQSTFDNWSYAVIHVRHSKLFLIPRWHVFHYPEAEREKGRERVREGEKGRERERTYKKYQKK